MNKLLLLFITTSITVVGFTQTYTQTVRGKVYDDETQFPIPGAKIQIFTSDTTLLLRAKADPDGLFEINNVPVGKHQLVASYVMYNNKDITIEVNSGKETVIDVPMKESLVEQGEVVVVGRKQGEVNNENALISAQQFSVSETDRYAGSRSDPARMASNFAGVSGADDSRNDIVIRGNSPLGVLYKVEGIDIPNPNHFAISGSTGGPVSILNNKILANSDFLMSAFPAEYGNSTSGVFDLKLRAGNKTQHEFTGQLGFLGTELLAEGPMGKGGNSSYLIMGRYSTLDLFKSLGISVGTDAIPRYGDGAMNFNWRLKNSGNLSLFAIGGASQIAIKISDQTTYSEELYGEGDRDQYFGTAMGVVGLSYKQPLSEKTLLRTTLAYSFENQHANHDYLWRTIDTTTDVISVDAMYPIMGFRYNINKVSAYTSVNHKINKKHLIKAGVNIDYYMFDMLDSVLVAGHTIADHDSFQLRWDYQGGAILAQPFVQWKWRASEKTEVTAGLHSQYFSMSNSLSPIEPRVGWRTKIGNNQAVFAGAGLHSQTQPMYIYTYHLLDANGNKVYHNKNMDFSKSIHTGVGYSASLKGSWNVKTEAYYQSLYNIPVTNNPSAFSLINMGSGFSRFFPDTLKNEGTGYNYGVELTVQKFFDKSFFFMFSATLYNSKYTGSDNNEYNTSYNGNYIANLLAGKEFKLGDKNSISIGLKVTGAGGKRYGEIDVAMTDSLQEIVFLDSNYNGNKFKDYFRTDLKVNWKYNGKRITHEIGLDLVNILNTQNILSYAYAPDLAHPEKVPVSTKYQLGFLPLFYYRVDFNFAKE